MIRLRGFVAIAVLAVILCAAPLPALAQAVGDPDSAPSTAPSGTSSSEVDSPAVQKMQTDAMDAYANGDYGKAAVLFDEVAQQSVVPSTRASAAKMAARAQAQTQSQSQTSSQEPPPAQLPAGTTPTPPPGAQGGPPPPPPPPGGYQGGGYQGYPGYGGQPPAGVVMGQPYTPDDGKPFFLYGMMANAAFLWGPMTIGLANPHPDSSVGTGAYLLAAGGTFLVSYLYVQHKTISSAVADVAVSSAWWGAAHGVALEMAIHNTNLHDVRALWGSMLGMSLGETIAATALLTGSDITEGQAVAIEDGGALGTFWGIGTAALLNADRSSQAPRLFALSALAGTGIGWAGGALVADHRDYSAGDSATIFDTLLIGTYAAAAPLAVFRVHEDEAIIGTLMGGSALGALVGDRLVDGRNVTYAQSGTLGLGALAGGLLGTGVVLVSSMHPSGRALLIGSSLGTMGGFALMWADSDIQPMGAPPPMPATRGFHVSMGPFIGTQGQKGLSMGGTF
jgi:hypothetical protein